MNSIVLCTETERDGAYSQQPVSGCSRLLLRSDAASSKLAHSLPIAHGYGPTLQLW